MNEIEKGQLAKSAIQCFQSADGSLSSFPKLLKRVIEEKVWLSRINNGREIKLKNLRELITFQPVEGWGQDPDKVEAILKDDAVVLPMFREAMKLTNQHDKPSDNVTKHTESGNSRAYTLTRLQKDHPAIYEEVKDGKLSANAGAIKAGFRKVKTPLEKAQKAYDALDESDRAAFALWLDSHGTGS